MYYGVTTQPSPDQGSQPISIRPAGEGDEGFIFKSWMNSLYYLKPWRDTDKNWFFAAQHALIRQLMARPGTVVLVACSVRYEGQLYGYVVAEPLEHTLHFIYTKTARGQGAARGYRRAKVATRLMEAAFPDLGLQPVVCSIRTPVCAQLPSAWRLDFKTSRLCRVVR